MEDTESVVCGNCGARIRTDSPVNLCARCLLADAVAHTQLAGKEAKQAVSAQDSTATPAYRASRLPEAKELQSLFPELDFLELLGAGGMGAVFKARQSSVDRVVAVKILSPAVEQDVGRLGGSEFVARFRREAKALAKLAHPNVVGLYEFGERGGFHYLIMEFVDGADLQKLIASGKLDPGVVLELVPQICAALHYAHEKGVTHRDIKPANILVDKSGTVKIADFGLARVYRGVDSQVALTNAGQLMGTPFYMAPEQLADPEHVDQRADIYSLGVVIYQMLTGQLPQGNFSPPSALQPRLGKAVDHAVMRALAHDPAMRFHDVTELQQALEQGRVSERSDGSTKPRRMVLAFAAIPLLLAGLLMFVPQWHPWIRSKEATSSNTAPVSPQGLLPGMRFFKEKKDLPSVRPLAEPRLSSQEAEAIKALFVNKTWRQPIKGGYAVTFAENGLATLREFAQEEWTPARWTLLSDGGVFFFADNIKIYRVLDFSSSTDARAYTVVRDDSQHSLYRINAAAPVSDLTLHRLSDTEINCEHIPKRGRWEHPKELPSLRPVSGIQLTQANLDWITTWFAGRRFVTTGNSPFTCDFKADRTAIVTSLGRDGQVRRATWRLLPDGGVAVKIQDPEQIGLLFDFRNPATGTVYRVVEAEGTAEWKIDQATPDLRRTTASSSTGANTVGASLPDVRLTSSLDEVPLLRPVKDVKLSPEKAQAIQALFVNKIWRQPVKGGYAIAFSEKGHAMMRDYAQEEWCHAGWTLLPDGGVVFSKDNARVCRVMDFESDSAACGYQVARDDLIPNLYRREPTPARTPLNLYQGSIAELDKEHVAKRGRWARAEDLPSFRPVPGIELPLQNLDWIRSWFVGRILTTTGPNPVTCDFQPGGTAVISNLAGDGRSITASWKLLPDGGVALKTRDQEPIGLLFDLCNFEKGTVYRVIESEETRGLKLDQARPDLRRTVFSSPFSTTTISVPITEAGVPIPGMRVINAAIPVRPLKEPKLNPQQSEVIKALFVNKIWRFPIKAGYSLHFQEDGHVMFRGYACEEWVRCKWELLSDGGVVFSKPAGLGLILDFSSTSEATSYKVLRQSTGLGDVYSPDARNPMFDHLQLYEGNQAELNDGLVPKRGRWDSASELPHVRPVSGTTLLKQQLDFITTWFAGHTVQTQGEKPLRMDFEIDGKAVVHNFDHDDQSEKATWKILPDGGVVLKIPEQAPVGLVADFRDPKSGTVYRITEAKPDEFTLDQSNPALQSTTILNPIYK